MVNSRARMLNCTQNCYTVNHMNQFVASMDAYLCAKKINIIGQFSKYIYMIASYTSRKNLKNLKITVTIKTIQIKIKPSKDHSNKNETNFLQNPEPVDHACALG